MSADGVVRYERRGATAFVTVDRPAARNAMTWAMYDQLDAALARLEEEEGVRAVVLRGAGGRFVAGTDIAQFTAFASAEDGVAYERRLEAAVARLEALPLPTLAVIERDAVGGGLALAAACDLRLCTPDARFGMPIARTVGHCLTLANHARLVAHLGPARTKALLLTADFLGAEDARAAGFVLEVVPPERLDARVAELCERIAGHAPITMRITKEAVARVLAALRPGEGEDLLREAYASRDFREGVEAFLAKRPPRWEGR